MHDNRRNRINYLHFAFFLGDIVHEIFSFRAINNNVYIFHLFCLLFICRRNNLVLSLVETQTTQKENT